MGCEDSEWALAHGLPPGGLLRLESRTGSPAGFSRNVVTDLAGAKGKARSSLRILTPELGELVGLRPGRGSGRFGTGLFRHG